VKKSPEMKKGEGADEAPRWVVRLDRQGGGGKRKPPIKGRVECRPLAVPIDSAAKKRAFFRSEGIRDDWTADRGFALARGSV